MSTRKEYRKDGYLFVVPDKGFKKYRVYKDDRYLTSFGDRRYEQYRDKIGHYRSSDHGDKERRRLYRIRHKGDNLSDRTSAGYFSWKYLW